MTVEPGADVKAGRREWVGLAVLALPCLLYSMDLTVLYLALPKLSADLQPSSTQLLWITDIYGFLLAGLLLTMGTLGDRIGRRRLLLIGAVAFGAASLDFSPFGCGRPGASRPWSDRSRRQKRIWSSQRSVACASLLARRHSCHARMARATGERDPMARPGRASVTGCGGGRYSVSSSAGT
jgi:hypothetical protein